MEKSNLEIDPYTLQEALTALNKSLPKKIGMGHLYNLIYNKVKPELISNKGRFILIQYNEIVKVYDHIILSNKIKYATNGRKKAA